MIVADGRGRGRSTRSDQPYSYALMADDYVALPDYLKIDKTALVGCSDGAVVGLDIAIRHPERLSRLFANGANYTAEGFKASAADTPTFKAGLAHCAADYARMSPTPAGFDVMVARMPEMWATPPNYTNDQLRAITVPTVIFDGDHDERARACVHGRDGGADCRGQARRQRMRAISPCGRSPMSSTRPCWSSSRASSLPPARARRAREADARLLLVADQRQASVEQRERVLGPPAAKRSSTLASTSETAKSLIAPRAPRASSSGK